MQSHLYDMRNTAKSIRYTTIAIIPPRAMYILQELNREKACAMCTFNCYTRLHHVISNIDWLSEIYIS